MQQQVKSSPSHSFICICRGGFVYFDYELLQVVVGKVVSPINCSKPISTLAHIFISTKSHTDATLFQKGQGARQNLFAPKGDLLIKNLLLETSHVSCHLSSSPFKVPTLHFPKTKKSFLLCHSKLLPRRPSWLGPKKISSLPPPAPPAAATRT